MSIFSNVAEKGLIILRKLEEQQKEQRAIKIKNRISKQTHDVKLAKSLSPITKKLDEVNKFLSPITKKLDEMVKESNSENKKEMVITPSILSQETYKSSAEANKSLKLNQDKNHNMSLLGVPIRSVGGDKIQVYDNIYEFIPEIHKAISNSSYTGNFMKNDDYRRTLYKFLVDLGYNVQYDKKLIKINFLKNFSKTSEKLKKNSLIIYKEKE